MSSDGMWIVYLGENVYDDENKRLLLTKYKWYFVQPFFWSVESTGVYIVLIVKDDTDCKRTYEFSTADIESISEYRNRVIDKILS